MSDYGLNALAATMAKDPYQEGQIREAGLRGTLASTAQTQAQTARTQGLTPYEVEAARLGNLQGQADEAAGVQGAKSEQSLWEAKQKARQAQQAWEQLPEEHKVKMLTLTKQKSTAVIKGALTEVMKTGDTMAAVRFIEQNLPEAAQDKGWQQAIQQFQSLSPDQAIAKMNDSLARLASSDVMSDPKQQGEMISAEQKHGYDMELERLRGDNQFRTAQTKPPAADNLTNPELIAQWMGIYQDENQPPAVREKARQALDYLAKAGIQTKEGLLSPQTTIKETALPLIPGTSAAKAQERQRLYSQYMDAWNSAESEEERRDLTEQAIKLGIAKPKQKAK